jgi:hypothetical protein
MAKIKGVFLPDSVTISPVVSADQQAATVRVEKLQVSLGGVSGPLTVTRSATILIPIDNSDGEITIDQQVRGTADIQSGVRGLLLVQLGGNTFQVDLPSPGAKDKDFEKLVTSKLPKDTPYQATFFLLLERDADKPALGGLIVVDSLDVSISAPAKAKT